MSEYAFLGDYLIFRAWFGLIKQKVVQSDRNIAIRDLKSRIRLWRISNPPL